MRQTTWRGGCHGNQGSEEFQGESNQRCYMARISEKYKAKSFEFSNQEAIMNLGRGERGGGKI